MNWCFKLVPTSKKPDAPTERSKIDLLDLLFELNQLMDKSLQSIHSPEILSRLVRTVVNKTDVRRLAVFRNTVREAGQSYCFECLVDSKPAELNDSSQGDLSITIKKQSKLARYFSEEVSFPFQDFIKDPKVKFSDSEWLEGFRDDQARVLTISVHNEIQGFLYLEFLEEKKPGGECKTDDQLALFLRLLAQNVFRRMEREISCDASVFQNWLFGSFQYPVFLIDTKTKRIVKANKAVEKTLTAASDDNSVSPTSLVTLVESIVDKVNPRNPFVWCRAYLPNLIGDFYVVATSFSVEQSDHVYAALLPSSDKQWDFFRLLQKMSVGDLAAEAAIKQLYWDRLLRQVVTRLHSSLDLNIVLQLLVDNLGQCLKASRCLFVKSESSSLTVSHEYSDPSISPLGLGRTARFPEAVVNLFRAGPLSLSDVTALRNGSPIAGSDVSSMLNAGVNSLAGAPLVCNGVQFGVLIVIEEGENRDWTSNEMELVRMSCRHTAVAVELCMEHHKVKDQLYHASTFRNVDNRSEAVKSDSEPAPLREVESSTAKVDLPHLSKRELEVLRLIASGLSNKEIAGRLFLTASTVELHASRMRKKLKMKSRTQLVKYACDHGLV